ncbi:hypothetical protein FHX82_001140 [Amycolatopsis bartoniae]|uniref:DUF1992 domain-containing protein n=1 Tax=Amycolatopsis bartoniae TaxID=941986 RepID=A0A8H9IYH7_9PSEU|nr:DUF1992 domain-containing protein [Amycolatopsis bartoniae]MBB2934120.1 hypothetical protein [Amycolatopsis bartoniae]TVT05502.1 DUF1992 domain-containing protein [Amycolatopsis bartoniae]GHF84211.1 DUF1992 domain-containing protein [Amycolatopsis bartoniae]
MTERKPPGMSAETWVERQIRQAQERGAFDNLPGAGKPLPNLHARRDENWWIKQKLADEGLSADVLLPEPLRLRKEIDGLRESVRPLPTERQVRDAVAQLNRRIADWLRAPSGPAVPVGPMDADDVVRQWREDRPTVPKPPPPEAPRTRWWRR